MICTMQAHKSNSLESIISRSRELVQSGDYKQAYKLCRKAATSGASDADLSLIYGVCAYANANPSEAIKSLRKALRLRPGFKDALFNLGRILLACGKPEDAIDHLSRLATDHPDFPGAQTNLAAAYYSSGQLEPAGVAYQKAIDLAPENPETAELYNLLGSIYREREANALSEKAFRKALELDPGYADALANLCLMFEESAQIEAAAKASLDGSKRFSGDPRFTLTLAKCERRQGEVAAAIERLSEIDLEHQAGEFQAQVYYELGRLWDRQDAAQKAFDCFTKANEIIASSLSGDIKKDFYPKILKASSRFYAKGGFPSRKIKTPKDDLTPCFLIGFPRSGTTLLELTLAGHSGVAVMEEPPLILELYSDIVSQSHSYPMILDQLDAPRIADLRAQYFKRATDFTDSADKQVLINKHPLDTVFLPVINAVFPDAKIIFSARHPLDVCLSCWMQEFQLNAGNVHFLSLHDTADFYAATMDLWIKFQADAEIDHLVVSYEDIVDNHEHAARTTIEFLGLDWSASVLNHSQTAKSLPRVNTASYHQVTEPIYARSKNRWQKYRQNLGPVLSKLKPYAEHFGYDV